MRDLEKIRERRTYRLEGGHVRIIALVGICTLVGAFYIGMEFGAAEEGDVSGEPPAESHLLLMTEPRTPLPAPTLQYEMVLGTSEEGGNRLGMSIPTGATRAPKPAPKVELATKPKIPAGAISANTVGHHGEATELIPGKGPTKKERILVARKMELTPEENLATKTGGYTLQVKAFRTEEAASRFNKELRQNGYDAFVVRSQIPEKGTWYRVRIGHYGTLLEATEYQYHFENKEGLSTFVSPL